MLLKYVSKSKLKKLVDEFDPHLHAEKLSMVKEALSSGDPLNPIFFTSQCEIWLTYLAVHQELSMESFLQAYLYLLAQQQCDDLPLKVLNREDIECNDDILMSYLRTLAIHYPHVTLNEMKEAYLSFTGVNSWLMIISIPDLDYAKSSDKHSLLFDLHAPPVYPYFRHPSEKNRVATPIQIINTEAGQVLIIPPVALLQWLIKIYNPNSDIKLIPIFGRLTDITLYEDFHRLGMHPANLHSAQFVKNNLREAHGCYGPLSLAVHDIYYHYLARSLIPKHIIDYFMVVVMKALRDLCMDACDTTSIEIILTLVNCLDLPSNTLHSQYLPLNEHKAGSFLADYLMRSLETMELKEFDSYLFIKFCENILKNPSNEISINHKEFVTDFLAYFDIDSLLNKHSIFPKRNQNNPNLKENHSARKCGDIKPPLNLP